MNLGSNATSTATTTTNSTAINGQQQQSISLPRGGEEVLINGGGHYHHHHGRSRSYQKPSATRNHHYGKHLFTSSSIDVAVTSESGIKTENQSINRTAAIDLNSVSFFVCFPFHFIFQKTSSFHLAQIFV